MIKEEACTCDRCGRLAVKNSGFKGTLAVMINCFFCGPHWIARKGVEGEGENS